MSVKEQITETLDLIPESELRIILDVVRHFVPIDSDDIATADDLTTHGEALREYRAGEVIAHEEIDWD